MQRPATERRLLRLRAEDAEDVAILSAQLQDAILPVADVAYLADRHEFVMVVNRFMWHVGLVPRAANGDGRDNGQDRNDDRPVYLRTNCGVCIKHVRTVQLRGIDLRERSRILNLLAMQLDGNHIDLHFSGDGRIRLTVDRVNCRMQDLDEPWPTRHRPCHSIEDEDRTA